MYVFTVLLWLTVFYGSLAQIIDQNSSKFGSLPASSLFSASSLLFSHWCFVLLPHRTVCTSSAVPSVQKWYPKYLKNRNEAIRTCPLRIAILGHRLSDSSGCPFLALWPLPGELHQILHTVYGGIAIGKGLNVRDSVIWKGLLTWLTSSAMQRQVFAQQEPFTEPKMNFYIFWDSLKKPTASSLVAS